MKQERENKAARRRDFLKLAGGGTAGGVAVALASAGGTAEAASTPAGEAPGYRESEHVRKVYELARF